MTAGIAAEVSDRWRYLNLRRSRARVYRSIIAAQLGWALLTLVVAIKVFPTAIYWMSYYVANYHHGFVRRGLGGEILGLFPAGRYFDAAYVMMWIPVLVWLGALGWLMRLILPPG